MGPLIAGAPVIYSSPLYVPGGDDLTEECLFVKGYWRHIAAHLKWMLFHKGLRFRYRLVTDEKLKNVYLGKEAYAAKAKDLRDADENYNSLTDLIGEDFSLVIICLGYLGYKNVAAAGILKEALMLRETMGKPTWLIEDSDSIWTEGHRSYSWEVGQYVAERFRTVVITGADPGPRQPAKTIIAAPEGEDLCLDDMPVEEEVPALRDFNTGSSPMEIVEVPENLPDMSMVMGPSKPKGFSKRKQKKGGNTGGGLSGLGV